MTREAPRVHPPTARAKGGNIIAIASGKGGVGKTWFSITLAHALSRGDNVISDMHTNEEGVVPLITLSPQWEQAFVESLVGDTDDKQLSMQPSRLQEFINGVRNTFERQAMMGEMPVLLTSPSIRPFVRSVVERFRPMTVVMSQNEVHPKVKIKTVGNI